MEFPLGFLSFLRYDMREEGRDATKVGDAVNEELPGNPKGT